VLDLVEYGHSLNVLSRIIERRQSFAIVARESKSAYVGLLPLVYQGDRPDTYCTVRSTAFFEYVVLPLVRTDSDLDTEVVGTMIASIKLTCWGVCTRCSWQG
jgi:hypothetical protein